ncbi:RICIN domain-containing protein [Siphonobacter sp. SORGH_AS_1065]|uniref:RICIN domain-containing protein n=1 Tax=Siphonobacter sp. SORGH_AS_1065 TaxID=3041795 RepID=UPI0027845D4F|nr:RICIN domain-containing protein [Siphonobacter sp. SORGH_AS_1065]MDQ1086600.1 hypothetical protein [Siphonobacter sp. SORGH_AS_1065]
MKFTYDAAGNRIARVKQATTSGCDFAISTSPTASASCGGTVSLSASCSGNDCSGVSYSWSGPNGFTGSGSSVSLTAPGTAGSYTYTVTASKSGCTSQQKQVTLTVSCGGTGTCNYTNNQLLGHANGVNAGQALYVKVVGNCKYIAFEPGGESRALDWLYMLRNNNGWASGVTPLTSDEIPVCFKQPGESCPGGCSTPAAPNVSASATSINSGQSSTLTASNCSGTVTWSSGQSGSSIQVSPTATTTYTATCTVGSCSSPASSGVTVTVGNRLQVAISGITGQASTKKRVTISNPYSGNRTYLWYIYRDSDMQYIGYGTDISSSTGVFDVDLASYNLVSGTVYRLYVGDTGDSGNSRHGYNTFTIGSSASNCNFTVSTPSTVSAGCGGTVSLSASCSGNDCSGVSYSWSGPNNFTGSGSSVSLTAPGTAGSYTYTVTASKSGCTTQQKQVTLTVSCGATGTCNYTNNQLLGHANGVNAGQALYVKVVGNCKYIAFEPGGESRALDWLYMLRNNNGWASGVTPLTSDEIPVCFKQPSEGCSSTSSCAFTVSTPSTASASCGATVSLSASCSGNDCSGVSYSWSGPNGFTGSGSSVSLTAPGTAGSYTYTVTASKSGCTSQQKQVTLTVSCGATGQVSQPRSQVDGGDCTSIWGWAFDGGNTQSSVSLDVYINGTKTATIPTNVSRADVASYYGTGSYNMYGFSYSIPASVKNGTQLSVSLKFAGTQTELSGSPKVIGVCQGSGGCATGAPSVSASATSITSGQKVTLSASGCSGTVTWSNGQTGSSLVVRPAASMQYTATCSANGCTSSASATVSIQVTTSIAAGCYRIQGFQSEKYLQDRGLNTQLQQYTSNGQNNQLWKVESVGSGLMKIISTSSGYGWDIDGASQSDGAILKLYSYGGGSNQQFGISYVNDEYGGFRVTPSHASNKCVEIGGFSVSDGGNAAQQGYAGNGNQRWVFVPATCPSNSMGRQAASQYEISEPVTKLLLVPNPAESTVELQLSSSQKVKQATIFDMQGRTLLESTESKIDIRNLPVGSYLIHVLTETGERYQQLLLKK